jgi:hypothetical protein
MQSCPRALPLPDKGSRASAGAHAHRAGTSDRPARRHAHPTEAIAVSPLRSRPVLRPNRRSDRADGVGARSGTGHGERRCLCPIGAGWRRPARLLLGHGWSRPSAGAAGVRCSSIPTASIANSDAPARLAKQQRADRRDGCGLLLFSCMRKRTRVQTGTPAGVAECREASRWRRLRQSEMRSRAVRCSRG